MRRRSRRRRVVGLFAFCHVAASYGTLLLFAVIEVARGEPLEPTRVVSILLAPVTMLAILPIMTFFTFFSPAERIAVSSMVSVWACYLGIFFAMRYVLRRDPRYRDEPLPGICPACGYDLRATPGRCPECGTLRRDEAAA